MPSLIVLKFGSSVLANAADAPVVVREIERYLESYDRILLVVSAFGNQTDALERAAYELCATPAESALALYLGLGEVYAVAELTLALQGAGIPAVSRMPSEVHFMSDGPPLDAMPESVNDDAIMAAFRESRVIVFPGFLSRSRHGQTQLLGRGGSDLTAVFLSHALAAERCVLVKNTDGVYEWDPAAEGPPPRRYHTLSWDHALEIGGGFVQAKALACAREKGVTIEVTCVGETKTTTISAQASRLETHAVANGSAPKVDVPAALPSRFERNVPLLLVGWGHIARALADLIVASIDEVGVVFGLRPTIAGLCDRSGYLFSPDGLSRDALRAAAAHKHDGGRVAELDGAVGGDDAAAEMLRAAQSAGIHHALLVDLSNAETGALFAEALRGGVGVVTANKIPLAQNGNSYQSLRELVAATRLPFRSEATVGAGLPIVDTLEMMRVGGDRFRRAEACLSGTLNYILSSVEAGETFSEALDDAVARGYAEPDPAEDISGEDVRRKAIILSRIIGADVSFSNVVLEPLVSADGNGTDHAKRDAAIKARVDAARADGHVLRYVAHIDTDRIDIGPMAVDPDSPLARTSGTDNTVVVYSDRYDTAPLVIGGPGAGVEVTALAVWTDILRAVSTWRPSGVR